MKMNIKILARCFEIMCLVLIPVVLAAPALLWFFGDKLMDSTYGINLSQFSFWQRLCMFLINSIGSTMLAYGLWLCFKIARRFKQDEIFTATTAGLFARMSKVAACWGLYNMLELAGIYTFLMPNNPKQLSLLLLVASGTFYLFIFVFLSVLATLVAKASDLQKDQDLTV